MWIPALIFGAGIAAVAGIEKLLGGSGSEPDTGSGDKSSPTPKPKARRRMTPSEWVAHGRKLQQQEDADKAAAAAERQKEIERAVRAAQRKDE